MCWHSLCWAVHMGYTCLIELLMELGFVKHWLWLLVDLSDCTGQWLSPQAETGIQHQLVERMTRSFDESASRAKEGCI